mmetsp:Transcript_10941/g.26289  ORF Transcript_10941/g.26289 Transcript_10941/m.26289 type:complete len:558 (-) Transcript_10941:1057-2730(-)
MTAFRSCCDSLRSFLNRRRRIKYHGSENERKTIAGKHNSCRVHPDEIEREPERWIHDGPVDDRTTRSCCCESDSGDEPTRKIGSAIDGDDGVLLRGNHLNNDADSRTVHYFNHASQAPLSEEVQKLGIDLLRSSPWNNTDDRHSAAHSQAQIRCLFAALIDGDKNTMGGVGMQQKNPTADDNSGSRIAMFPSTAFAITLAARNIIAQRNQRGNRGTSGRILVLQDEFDSAVYPWQQVCDESGGRLSLDIVGHPDKGADSNGGSAAVSGSRRAGNSNSNSNSNNNTNVDTGDADVDGWTRAVLEKLQNDHDPNEIVAACLPPLHWSDGTILDLEIIGAVCKARGIPLIVDATQAVGIMPCSVRKIRPTMLACSSHKWLRGPSGCCLAYISPEVQESWVPLDFHGRGRDFEAGSTSWDVSRNEMGPRGYPETFYGDARKFDSGGKANPLLLPLLRKAMEEIASIDAVEAQLYLEELMQPLLNWAVGNGYSVNTSSRAYHLIGLIPNNKTPEEMIDIEKRLASEKRVILAVRCGGLRVSPYLTTTKTDVRKLIEGLEELS